MDAKKFNLGDLLKKLQSGEIQLPDFQRDWIWDDDKIKSLLESVIRGFPINSIMLLECDADNIKFACRTLEGVVATTAKPQYLILDGQQRLTSLYGALFSNEPVAIKKGRKSFYYYVDMAKAIDAVKNSSEVEDMIISVPPNKKLKSKGVNWDLSTQEKEFAAGMFPLNKIFGAWDWIFGYTSNYAAGNDKKSFIKQFNDAVISSITHYEIVAIELEKNTALESVCKIFEKVNKGVAELGVFDLLTSIFAAKTDDNGNPIKLRDDWTKLGKEFADKGLNILTAIDCSDFVTALTLLVSYEKFCLDKKTSVSCKGEDILKLDYKDYVQYREDITEGFIEAGKFLEEEGISTLKYLPYKSQLIPMSAIFAELKLSGKDNAASRNKIRQWYWCCVFGESYKDGQGARYAKDIVQVMKWINKREEPDIIKKTQIGALRLMTLKSTASAAYKGMISIIFKNGAKDFIAGKDMGICADYAESIEIHHVFPKKYCDTCGISKDKYDSIANKTLILKGTNKIIGGNPPSDYLAKIERKTKLSSADVDEILEQHFIDAELCRADNFDAFIVDRAEKILDAVEKLTGRKVDGRDSPEIKKLFGASLK